MDSIKWEEITDKQTSDVKQYMGAFGVGHKIIINKKSYIKSTIATSFDGVDLATSNLNNQLQLVPEEKTQNKTMNVVLTSFINTKINARHANKTGFTVTRLAYNLLLENAPTTNLPLQTIVDEKGSSFLLTAYSNSTYNFSDKLTMNAGINTQLFTLNNHYTIEPRIGVRYQFNPKQSFTMAYGLHSRLERINYYFIKNPQLNNEALNKNLDFTKSHHIVIGYDNKLAENLYLKTEVYYQNLFNVPVIKDSPFSFINLQKDWFFNSKLENIGKGRNYGIDISLDLYMHKGLYYMLTTSLFNSQYQGGDKVWRNTRFNRNIAFNFLIGKEWQFGKNNNKSFGLNTRLSYQGGNRYSPINEIASIQTKNVVFDENKAFSK